jgi:phospholipase/carboxylesterase
MFTLLDGPRRKPAIGGMPKSLIVLLHGLGANGDDLMALAGPLARALPDAAFAAPHAPERCDMVPFGFQWFSLQDRDPHRLARGADNACGSLAGFIEAELGFHRLDMSRLALVGFSQGTMMALHLGLRLAPAPAAIVGFSGALVAPERLDAEKRGSPPVLLVHGTADEVVPFFRLEAARSALRSAGIPVDTLVRPNLGHSVDDEGVMAAACLLHRCLGQG